ncbi:hypothetical protein AMJ52_08355 [candidate division TA06 bacterium DG_78]|uniref:Uncharacterized protein n=1 Tax=candidate division TA06 bacterium DG_78 TaxID=1703772 RepID=A0A0S7YAL0_UNCT6|nr:MAG: hypothetical protein AMJ52_08355 [candidate division TA06 bacterium DG_78]
MIIKATVYGVFCSILLMMVGAALFFDVDLIDYTGLPIVLFLGMLGPFVAGFILKKNGWFVGAITIVIVEIIHVIFLLWYVTNMFSPSSVQTLPVIWTAKHDAYLYSCGGLAVFVGALIGLLGERLGSRIAK